MTADNAEKSVLEKELGVCLASLTYWPCAYMARPQCLFL